MRGALRRVKTSLLNSGVVTDPDLRTALDDPTGPVPDLGADPASNPVDDVLLAITDIVGRGAAPPVTNASALAQVLRAALPVDTRWVSDGCYIITLF